jgi:tRNA A37 N6-isopentenylltransferase MiaA
VEKSEIEKSLERRDAVKKILTRHFKFLYQRTGIRFNNELEQDLEEAVDIIFDEIRESGL